MTTPYIPLQTTTTTLNQNTKPPFYADPQVWAIGGGILVIGLIKLFQVGSPRKQKLGRSRFASWREIRRAQDKAYKQVLSPKLTDIALWIGIPRKAETHGKKLRLPMDRSCIWLAEISQHLSNWAATGSGKSFSIINPLKRSAILQGHTIIDFDAKGDEPTPPSCETAGYALKHGYKVYVIAPGDKNSDRLNTWDFISHESDSDRATNKADSLMANFKMGGKSGGGNSEFFTKAAGQMLSAIFMMIKGLSRQYQDMATAQKILSLPDLVERVKAAKLPEYQKAAWGQFLSTAGSPETAASIASTASIILSRFFTPDILSVFHGLGECPTELHGRVMVVFRLNPEMESMKPLIAAGLQMMINRNVFCQRKNPVGIFLDEIPQIRILGLETILNVARSKGAYFILGSQGFSVLENTYGKAETKNILGATLTQIVGRLYEEESQNYFSKQIGKEEVKIQGKSRTMGKNRSKNRSENTQTAELQTIQEIKGLEQGQFIFFSPEVGKKQKSIPFKQFVRISKDEKKTIEEGLEAWAERPQSGQSTPLTDKDLKEREAIAYKLLPLDSDPENDIDIIQAGL